MNTRALVFLSLLALGGAAQAQQIYLCTDASGHKELTDTRKGANCKPLDLPAPSIAAPAREGRAMQRLPAPAATPGNFPRVDSSEQKARDADRKAILSDELNAETKKLAELRKEFNGGEPERRGDERNYAKYQDRVASLKESIARSEQNVEALKREIANIK
jgi:phage shock protein A